MHVSYSAPWAELVARHIQIEKETPVQVTATLIESIVTEAETQASTSTHEAAIFESTGLSVIKKDIVDVKLNGYSVKEVVGQYCTSIEITLLSELVPHIVQEALKESEKNLLAHAHVLEHTSAKICATGVQRLFPQASDSLIVEITGEATECTVVKNGVVYENFFSLSGTHTFERELAHSLGTIPEEAQAHVQDYVTSTSHPDVEVAIHAIRDTYKLEITALLQRVELKYTLPGSLVVLVDPLHRDMYVALIEEIYAALKTGYKLFSIDGNLLEQFVTYSDNASRDDHIALAALFFHTEHTRHAVKLTA
jgi:hypothetical protein